jgi:outer membrane protein TolC
MRSNSAGLALLEQQIEVDRDLLELTELRFEAGLTASVDVLQQSSQLAETESLVPPTEALLRDFGKPLGCVDRAGTGRG